MLDGTHEVEAIFSALSDVYPVEQVFAALNRLRASGYLAEDASAEARPTQAFWEHVGVPPAQARTRLDAARVSDRGDSATWSLRRLRTCCGATG